MSKSRARRFADIISGAEQVPAESLDNASVTAISDQVNTSTGFFDLPSGTTAQRPASPTDGATRFNTDSGSVEFYDGVNWLTTNLIPVINSISGSIYSGASSSISLNLSNATDKITVIFSESGVALAEVSDVAVASGIATVSTPSAVYGKTVGSTITVTSANQDGTPASNSVSTTIKALPSGGTVSSVGSYRVHTFTSSGTLSVPSGFSASAEYLIVGGGGGGGYDNGGGGGAGGFLEGSTSITANNYSVIVGGGGGYNTSVSQAGDGGSSSFANITALGGGGAGSQTNYGRNGGSGGGSGHPPPSRSYGGLGTAGQGNNGGGALYEGPNYPGGGGGGAGGAGETGTSSTDRGGDGGVGKQSNIDGNNYYYAGGGGGSAHQGGNDGGTGGLGGGGAGGSSTAGTAYGGGSARNSGGNTSSATGASGGANTGGGAGGGSHTTRGGNGGSGIVIIRYVI
jgi:hypothetical protein